MNINAERFFALTAMLAAPLVTALGCDDGDDGTASSGDPTGESAGTDDTAAETAGDGASDAAGDTAAASDTAADDTGGAGAQAIDCTCTANCDGTAVDTPWQVCGTDPSAATADGQAACETGLGAMCETFACAECSCVTAETASVTCE